MCTKHHIFIAILICSLVIVSNGILTLNNADYNRNSLVGGRLVSVLKGNVEFEYDNTIIQADKATWYRNSGNVTFTGNINVIIDMQELHCKRMELFRKEKKITASRSIVFIDKKEHLELTAKSGEYHFDTKDLLLFGKPKLVQYDTTLLETLSIMSRTMIYDDSLKRATARDRVIITKGLLTATCKNATYYTETGYSQLRTNPSIIYDIHKLNGDSIDLFFTSHYLEGISVMRRGKGQYCDITNIDTIHTKLFGDSLFMDISRDGGIKSIHVVEDAIVHYYASSTPDLLNQAFGRTMVLFFEEGETGLLTIAGNAESVYYLDGQNDSGRNEASGDSLSIHFANGKAHYLNLSGGVRGVFFSKSIKK